MTSPAARTDAIALLARYYAAFNAGDWAGMLDCLSDDVAHDVNQGGRVVGTPFYGHPVMTEVGKALVEFGCAYVCIWPDQAPITGLPRPQGGSHGPA